jgi:acyl carrier protein
MNISIDPRFKYFLNNRELKDETIKRYTRELVLYCESTGLSPTELIMEARNEQVKHPWINDRNLPSHLTNYISFMESRNYAPYRIKNAVNIIRTFYNEFDIQLPQTKYKGEPASSNSNIDDLPGYDDIRKAITLSNIKYRAIISLMTSSAMSVKDIRFIRVAEFLEAIGIKPEEQSGNDYLIIPQNTEIDENRVAIWQRRSDKSLLFHVTFSTPESIHFILDYLNKYPPESPDDFLFRSQRNPTKPSSDRAFQKYFQKINQEAGWKKNGYTHYFTTKTLRKYFRNTLERLKIPHLHIRIMMGHNVKDVNIESLKESYKSAIPSLTFLEKVNILEKEIDITTNPEYIKLLEKVNTLEKMVKKSIERSAKEGSKTYKKPENGTDN